MDEATVLAPATVSNVVCGFDCLGFPLNGPIDLVTVRRNSGNDISIVHNDDFGLPLDPKKNVAGVVLQKMLDAAGADFGLEVEIRKGIKPGSGIGSSSASSCGAAAAANKLLDERFSRLELVEFAMYGEKLASGARHADNVAPCMFGGFTLVRSTDPLDIIELDFPPLFATIIHPQIEIKTSEARALLPAQVPLADAVSNWSNLAALIAALAMKDIALIGRSMHDAIIEPVRSRLIPRFEEVKKAGLGAGALGGGISGSGPSIFMLSATQDIAVKVEEAISAVYADTGIAFHTYVSEIDPHGARTVI